MNNQSKDNLGGIESSKGYDDKNNDNRLTEVKNHLEEGKLDEADNILKSIAQRNAMWYYCMGLVHLRKGWYDSALNNISIASEMEPQNEEYASMLRRVKEQAQVYKKNYEMAEDDNDAKNFRWCRCCFDDCGVACGSCCCC